MNYNNTTVIRGALKFAPSDSLTITPSIYYQKQRSQDNYFWETLSNPSESDFNNGYTQAEPVVDKFTLPCAERTLAARWHGAHLQHFVLLPGSDARFGLFEFHLQRVHR